MTCVSFPRHIYIYIYVFIEENATTYIQEQNNNKFSECVQTLNMPMSIIGVTETWFKNNEMDLSLPSYSFVGNARRGRRGGGVGIFVHNNIKFKRRCDLDICNDVVESIFIEMYNEMKNYIIAVI